jgi:hypothetical protein
MEVNLTIDFNYVGSIFAMHECTLLQGEKIYFSKRHMLASIYNQLPRECKDTLIEKYPHVMTLLGRTTRLT